MFSEAPSQAPVLSLVRSRRGVVAVHPRFDQGNEHEVYRSVDDPHWVIKAPRSVYGTLWQDMSAEAAARDIDLLREYGMPFLYTRLFRGDMLEMIRGRRHRPSYLLEQPYFSPYPAASYPGLIGKPHLVEQISEMFSIRHRIFRDHGLGADIMGGDNSYRNGFGYFYERARRAVFKGALPAFRFDPFIPNLLVPEKDVRDERGARIVEAGKVILADVRLFRLKGAAHFYRKRIERLLQVLYDAETGAGVTMLRHLGGHTEEGLTDPGNFGNRLGQNIARLIMEDADLRAAKTAPAQTGF